MLDACVKQLSLKPASASLLSWDRSPSLSPSQPPRLCNREGRVSTRPGCCGLCLHPEDARRAWALSVITHGRQGLVSHPKPGGAAPEPPGWSDAVSVWICRQVVGLVTLLVEGAREEHFMTRDKNFNSSTCNVMYLRTKRSIFMDIRWGKIRKHTRVSQKLL